MLSKTFIFVLAKDMNLCIQPDVYCDTSSYYSGYACEAAIDGILVAGIGKEWASAGEMNGAWIKVMYWQKVDYLIEFLENRGTQKASK